MSSAHKVFALDARPHASNPSGRSTSLAASERSPEVFARIPRSASVAVMPGNGETNAAKSREEQSVSVVEMLSIHETTRKNLDARSWTPMHFQHTKASSRVSGKFTTDSADVSALLDAMRQDMSAQKDEQWQKAGALEASVMHLRRSLATHEEQQELQGVLVQDTIRDLQQQRAAVTYLRTEHDKLHRLTEQEGHNAALQRLREVQQEQEERFKASVAEAHERVGFLQTEHQEQATAIRQLMAAQQDRRVLGSMPQSSGNSWESIWRRELQLLRAEQQAALADQVRLLKREFESAYRAEQLAEAATSRQVALERGMVEVQQKMDSLMMSHADLSSAEVRQLENLNLRITNMETDTANNHNGEAQCQRQDSCSSCSVPPATSCTNSAETIVELRRHLNDVAAAVAGQAEKLDRVQHELTTTCATQHGQLAEALEQNQHVTRSLESQSAACHESVIELREGVLQGLASADNSRQIEERCQASTEALRAECMACMREIAAQRETIANTKLRVKAERDDCLRLGKSHASLAKELADVNCFVSEQCTALRKSLDAETEARTCEQSTFRAELTAAMAVIKTQFGEWMDVVTSMKAELSELARSFHDDRENRLHELSASRTELATVAEIAYRELSRNRVEFPSEVASGVEVDMLTKPAGLDVESRPAEWLWNAADSGAINTAAICKLVLEVFNHCDRLSHKCASDCAECQLEVRTVVERVDPALQRFDEWRRDWEADMPDVRKLLEAIDKLEAAAATTRRELDAAMAGLHERDECRFTGVAQDLCRLLSRVDCIESQMADAAEATSRGGNANHLEARRSVIRAVESVEAAAQRVVLEAAAEEHTAMSSLVDLQDS